ncbi:tRNA uridine-5-carboxymethylaminomethyl(34) synthesis GTPase MnmE [Rhizobiaceae bacterium BDR2-2]|uniref:tRNA modification GTPase MnmE n=1 Tax=Ectorhizobium quercum TaxID=2965071 RepID=A0AAE3N1X7_9HYPH|nr:tRNA uridine-5-carboxymethylaminomethyl(34) synthesis GTPase MnmE [Ectorhizobium quercum]MCX8999498.1 tRNA uridine-5-carboxymethylaminomethyl(34) synthesis GTPase MnmE [Ectorhizobium quercum]
MTKSDDTIFALSSGGLPSGVAVVRLSGRQSLSVSAVLAGPLPEPRRATLRTIRARNEDQIDRGLVLIFPGPSSFTGEDCVEFHLHGGRAVVQRLLDELTAMPGLRQAEAGEFSRRAFENGKADLVEMEGLADLISAETEMQRRLAMEQSFGGLSALYDDWADRLTRARALIEAELDFADEEDVPGSVSDQVWSSLSALATSMRRHLLQAEQGEIIRNGLKVVIAGPPNAGKSSLMNALAGREVAIVTDLAGTTRDVLHADLDIGGYLVRLFDTAGLRETSETIEQEGIRRALHAAQTADILLHLDEIGRFSEIDVSSKSVRRFRIGTKMDQHLDDPSVGRYDLCISTATGAGLDSLRNLLIADLRQRQEQTGGFSVPVRARQVEHLRASLAHLEEALAIEGHELDVRSEFLRLAAHEMGKVTGRVDVEQLLDVIFSEFCIGK